MKTNAETQGGRRALPIAGGRITFPTPAEGSPSGLGRGMATFTKLPAKQVSLERRKELRFRNLGEDIRLWKLLSEC